MKRLSILLFTITVVLMIIYVPISAQEIDVDSMNNEQLTTLLLQILNKLQQEEEPEAVTPETPAAATAVSAADPEAIEEVVQITIYENKKLTVEALPGYMFIQPTKEPKPEPESESENPHTDSHEDLESYCTDKCMGYSDFYGIDMLDMGCYAKCVGDI